MTFIRIKATAIQAIFEYTRKKATLFYHEPTIYNHPIGTNPIWCPTKNQYVVMIQNLIYRTILHLLEFWMKSELY